MLWLLWLLWQPAIWIGMGVRVGGGIGDTTPPVGVGTAGQPVGLLLTLTKAS